MPRYTDKAADASVAANDLVAVADILGVEGAGNADADAVVHGAMGLKRTIAIEEDCCRAAEHDRTCSFQPALIILLKVRCFLFCFGYLISACMKQRI